MSDADDDHGTLLESDVATNNVEILSDAGSTTSTTRESYASVLATVEQERKTPAVLNRRLTAFEREHFLDENVTPDRPCTATFKTEKYMPASELFTALDAEHFPAASIRCLQRRPNGQVLVTFCNPEWRKAFLKKSSFISRYNELGVIDDSDEPLTYLNIYDAPYELPDMAIIDRLKPYCEVLSHRRGKHLGFTAVNNGLRHYRVRIKYAVPSFLRFGKFLVRLSHDGQEQTCRKCNQRGHFANSCENTVCFNCDSLGHISRECLKKVKCCICKSERHLARDCVYSWYRQPSLSPISHVPSPQASQAEREDALDFVRAMATVADENATGDHEVLTGDPDIDEQPPEIRSAVAGIVNLGGAVSVVEDLAMSDDDGDSSSAISQAESEESPQAGPQLTAPSISQEISDENSQLMQTPVLFTPSQSAPPPAMPALQSSIADSLSAAGPSSLQGASEEVAQPMQTQDSIPPSQGAPPPAKGSKLPIVSKKLACKPPAYKAKPKKLVKKKKAKPPDEEELEEADLGYILEVNGMDTSGNPLDSTADQPLLPETRDS